MPFDFVCPLCGHETLVDDRHQAQSGACIHCGGLVKMPGELDQPVRRRARTKWISFQLVGILGVSLLALAATFGFLLAFVFPMVNGIRQEVTQSTCQAHIEFIADALRSYHRQFDSFPPAAIKNENGTALHSWRVLLLTELGYQGLQEKYDFKQPWDSAHNIALSAQCPRQFLCPLDVSSSVVGETSYLLLVGPETLFPYDQATAIRDLTNIAGDRIMLVERADSGILWIEPGDLEIENMRFQVNGGPQEIGSHHLGGAFSANISGEAEFLRDDLPAILLQRRCQHR